MHRRVSRSSLSLTSCYGVSALSLKSAVQPQWWGLLWLCWRGLKNGSKCTHLIWAPKGLMGNCQCLINFWRPSLSFLFLLRSGGVEWKRSGGPWTVISERCVTGHHGGLLTSLHDNSDPGCSELSHFPPCFACRDGAPGQFSQGFVICRE